MTGPARRLLAGAAVVLAVGMAGCSEDSAPGESAPALATSLDEVDAAVESGDFSDARKAVDGLIAETGQALVAGEITDEEADAIFEAAREVLAHLPGPGKDESVKKSSSRD